MVLDEKDRNEILLRSKLAINKKNYQEFQNDIDELKTQIETISNDITNINRDNTTLELTNENK
jgi:peptidoglycan hydrolase CwlO-like protein